MKTQKGTPKTIDEALENAMEDAVENRSLNLLPPDSPTYKKLLLKCMRLHIRDFMAQKACSKDDATADARIEYFQEVFNEKPVGYLLALQWYYGAKHLNEFNGEIFKTEPGRTMRDLVGSPSLLVSVDRPKVPIGHILFAVFDDGKLELIERNYDSSD